MRSLYAAASGMAAQQTRLDTIANNLANVSTTAFKKSRESFEDLFYQELTHGGLSASTSRVEVGSGVALSGIVKDHRNGQITGTGGTFDLAIEGPGYFQVETQEGEMLYTRDGNFRLDQDGVLRTSAGLILSGNIGVPRDADMVRILEDGTILAENGTEATTIGVIELRTFVNPSGLAPQGGNLYSETVNSGSPLPTEPGESSLRQGFLEGSNVEVAEELIGMIAAQRAYELNSKVIQASDEVMRTATSIRR
jgi:flagellar basal-body rod protein FlgG